MTFRCRFSSDGIEVHSYPMNVLKRPGSSWRWAAATISRQASVDVSRWPVPNARSRRSAVPTWKKAFWRKCQVIFSREPVSSTSRRVGSPTDASPRARGTPRYSTWSVTAAKSSGREARIG